MKSKRSRIHRLTLITCATLAGGTVFGTCEMRVRDAFVNGSQLFVSQVLNPTNFLPIDESILP